MYTDRTRRFSPAGAGAALAVNGAVIAAMVFALAPAVVERIEHPDIQTYAVPPEAPPPPPVDEVKPKADEAKPLADPYVPPVIAPTHSEVQLDTTTVKPDITRVIDPGPGTGTAPVVEEKPAPPPPLIGAVPDPRFARDFQPEYPGSEIRTGREGLVAIRVLIGTDGRVKAVEQVSATSQAFFDATRRQALAKWRFKPASRGGVPQESWKVMNVRFELQGG